MGEQTIKVKCKHCGAEMEKGADQYRVRCPECGKETAYFVLPRPQRGGRA